MAQITPKKGRVLVLTGSGKGKSSSALGMVFRAAGWGFRVCVIQFIKGKRATGEQRAARLFKTVEWHALGDGFTWDTQNPEQDRLTNQETWRFAQEKIESDLFDLVLLDEINYVMSYGWLSVEEVAHFIQSKKPSRLDLILTGRGAPAAVVEVADTVTEMQEIKHGFQVGMKAKRGIEF